MRRHAALLVMVALAGFIAQPLMPHSGAARAAGTPAPLSSWLRWNAHTKTATVTIIAAYNNVAGGFNFDGYNAGHLTITVPRGATVVIAFSNKSPLPHSAAIVPFAQRNLAGNFRAAFPGSALPHAGSGVANTRAPLTFSFRASTAGTYALVCAVPGHAVSGMWDVFRVATVAQPSLSATGSAPTTTPPTHATGTMSTVQGVVQDATTGKPIAHAFIVLGWTTLMRAGETDASGHYRVFDVPPVGTPHAFGFAQGYVYVHGYPLALHAGSVTTYSFKMPRQTFADALLPSVSGATITPSRLKAGQMATFALHVTPGKGGPLSKEVFAVNGLLSHSVWLQQAAGTLYRGAWRLPRSVAPGSYTFSFFGAMENCLENKTYARVTLTVVK